MGKEKGVNIKSEAIGRKNMHVLPIDKIYVDPDWNERNLNRDDVRDHIKGLALSISKVGIRQPLTVVGKGDKIHLTDGFCRMAAAKLAIKEYGADIKGVPVIIEEKGTNEADHIATMLISNSGKPLSFSEQARVVKRLIAFGWSKSEIATKTTKSLTHIDNCVMLLEADISIMKHVDNGAVSARFALDTIRNNKPDKAAKVIAEAVSQARQGGKKKATARTARNNGKGGTKIQWAKHGPEFFRLLEELEKYYEAADGVADEIGDIVTWYKNYKEDKKITATPSE